MIKSNCNFLINELYDIVRLFKPAALLSDESSLGMDVECNLFYEGEGYYGSVCVDGVRREFKHIQKTDNDVQYKRYAKRVAKLCLYEMLSDKLDKKMPWGALTGIRPVKLAYSELNRGGDYVRLLEQMQVAEQNIKLVSDVIAAQRGIYDNRGGSDLYVSIPFCPSKCSYCSFITADVTKTGRYIEPYLDSLERELLASAPYLNELKSVYVGGGTPLVLTNEQLERVLVALEPYAGGVEYTVEAGRPDVFTTEKLSLLEKYNVNRICINPQTFCDKTLELIGRKHTCDEVYKAFDMCKKYNFEINCDLIAGFENENAETFGKTVEKAMELSPDNITVHTLCLKRGARMKCENAELDGDAVGEMVDLSKKLLYAGGYSPYYMYRQKYAAGNYENVGWCKTGKACVYNVDVMEEITDNVAVGANAVTKRLFAADDRIERYGSPKDVVTYIEKTDAIIEDKKKFFS